MNVWLPALRVGSGTDTFTERLAAGLLRRGIGVRVQWFPAAWEYQLRPQVKPPAGCDLMHANSWHAELFGGPLPRVSTVHICVHDPLAARFRSPAQALYHRYWIRRREAAAIRRSIAVTAVSHYTRVASLNAFGRFLEPRFRVIHNWVDTRCFAPADPPEVPVFRPFRLLFVGNALTRKGFDLLPGLMRRLGEGFELHYTRGRSSAGATDNLPANMHPVDQINEELKMAALYRSCDALLFPSRLEGFGYAALEAQACGLPVVGFAASSLPEIVINEETGLLVALDDSEGLETACRRLAGEPGLRDRLGDAARRRVLSSFAESILIADYIAIYEAALRGGTIPHD